MQTTIDFNFCLHAITGEGLGVSLTSSGAFAGIATLWMGMAEISVAEMAALIPGILV